MTKDEDGNYTPRSIRKIENTYEKIKDIDDCEITPWER
jgi:hypothetical protein